MLQMDESYRNCIDFIHNFKMEDGLFLHTSRWKIDIPLISSMIHVAS